MFQKKLIFFYLIFITIFLSCNKDTEPEIISEISITELSSNFLFQGDILTITGNNFINNNYQTKIIIDDVSYDIEPISNTQINLEINDDFGFEKKNIRISISDKTSEEKSFFIMPKQWYKISNENVIKAFIHDNSTKIFILASSADYFNGYLGQLDTSEDGYKPTFIFGNAFEDFKMYNADIGVSLMGTQSVYYTIDGLKTYTSFINVFSSFMWPNTKAEKVVSINETDFIIANGAGQHFRYFNNGDVTEISDMPLNTEMLMFMYKIGKGSNGLYYEFGHYYKPMDYDNYNLTSISYSPNGFDNWTIMTSPTPYNHTIMEHLFFYDYDLIFSINENHELIKSTDLFQTWEFVQSNVDAFFMKTETEWYKVSDDKLYYSNNSGNNWKFELDLPVDSEAHFMDFKNGKTIIAGSSFLYIKHE